jgi:hypothetical protein
VSKESAIKKLMQACEGDADLYSKLLANPQDVAGQYGVTLEPEEIEQFKRVQALQTLVAEFKAGRGIGHPIGYPVDVAWKATLANHIIFYRPIYYPIFYPIFYPIYYRGSGYPIGYIEEPTAAVKPFSGLRKLAARKRN